MDGWTDITHNPLINLIVSCKEGPHEGAIDILGKHKEAKFLFHILKGSIEEVDPFNMVLVTDPTYVCKVRSLTLDVRVWELSVISLFQSLGNMYANSIWEELLENGKDSNDAHNRLDDQQKENIMSINKPDPRDALSIKEKFIQAKYAEKQLVSKERFNLELPSVDYHMWEAVQRNEKQMAYRLLVVSDANIATTYEQAKLGSRGDCIDHDISESNCRGSMQPSDSGTSSPSSETNWDALSELEGGLKGCSLLHLACHTGDLAMLELLLQYGADVNVQDHHGRTPLHHCISKGKNQFAKLLIR
ncbi:hypothetical protein KI387_018005, partial [Taxus chinensis]